MILRHSITRRSGDKKIRQRIRGDEFDRRS